MYVIYPFIRKSFGDKFLIYRRSFLFLSLFFIFGFLPGALLARLDYFDLSPVEIAVPSVFSFAAVSMLSLLWLYLLSLFATPSVFGPFFCGVCSVVLGLKSGYFLIGLFFSSACKTVPFYLTLLSFLFLRGWILILWLSFSCCVSFALFEPPLTDKKLFGGSLFNAPYYRNVINTRFLFTFFLLFLSLVFIQFFIQLIYGYFFTLCNS